MLEQNDEKKIEELLDLERDNNRMLRSMRRSIVLGNIMTVIYWLIVIGGIGWTYYYFQPYVKQYINLYDTAMSAIDTLDQQSKTLPGNIKGLLEGMSSRGQ